MAMSKRNFAGLAWKGREHLGAFGFDSEKQNIVACRRWVVGSAKNPSDCHNWQKQQKESQDYVPPSAKGGGADGSLKFECSAVAGHTTVVDAHWVTAV